VQAGELGSIVLPPGEGGILFHGKITRITEKIYE
jgi:hypothetical protein